MAAGVHARAALIATRRVRRIGRVRARQDAHAQLLARLRDVARATAHVDEMYDVDYNGETATAVNGLIYRCMPRRRYATNAPAATGPTS